MASNSDNKALLKQLSEGKVTALDARRLLGGLTYGDLLRMLAAERLNLPRSDPEGRERELATARDWMFPTHAA